MPVKQVEVKEPAVRVQHDKYTVQRLFVLSNKDEWLKRPDDGTKLAGPALVLVQEVGLNMKVYVYRSLRDVRPWNWLGRLAKAGAWALSSSLVADYLPDELVAASPRFADTTEKQRQRKGKAARAKADFKKAKSKKNAK
jgi:hypothetical protein